MKPIEEVKSKYNLDPTLMELKAIVKDDKVEVFSQGRDAPLGIKVDCVCQMLMA